MKEHINKLYNLYIMADKLEDKFKKHIKSIKCSKNKDLLINYFKWLNESNNGNYPNFEFANRRIELDMEDAKIDDSTRKKIRKTIIELIEYFHNDKSELDKFTQLINEDCINTKIEEPSPSHQCTLGDNPTIQTFTDCICNTKNEEIINTYIDFFKKLQNKPIDTDTVDLFNSNEIYKKNLDKNLCLKLSGKISPKQINKVNDFNQIFNNLDNCIKPQPIQPLNEIICNLNDNTSILGYIRYIDEINNRDSIKINYPLDDEICSRIMNENMVDLKSKLLGCLKKNTIDVNQICDSQLVFKYIKFINYLFENETNGTLNIFENLNGLQEKDYIVTDIAIHKLLDPQSMSNLLENVIICYICKKTTYEKLELVEYLIDKTQLFPYIFSTSVTEIIMKKRDEYKLKIINCIQLEKNSDEIFNIICNNFPNYVSINEDIEFIKNISNKSTKNSTDNQRNIKILYLKNSQDFNTLLDKIYACLKKKIIEKICYYPYNVEYYINYFINNTTDGTDSNIIQLIELLKNTNYTLKLEDIENCKPPPPTPAPTPVIIEPKSVALEIATALAASQKPEPAPTPEPTPVIPEPVITAPKSVALEIATALAASQKPEQVPEPKSVAIEIATAIAASQKPEPEPQKYFQMMQLPI